MAEKSKLDREAKCRADLDAAVIAIRESNRLLKQSIVADDLKSLEKRLVRIRASRWKLKAAIHAAKALQLEEA